MYILDLCRELKTKINKKFGRNCVKITYIHKKDKLKVRCPHSFEDRNVKSLEMFMIAFEKAKSEIKGDLRLLLNCEDYPEKIITNRVVMTYSKEKDDTENVLFPDFCFLNWKESGMKDYAKCNEDMLEASKNKPEHQTLFWIGNPNTHPTRKILCELSKQDSRIEAYGMGWDYRNGVAIPNKFITLVDHTKYKYLIDVQGRGYSGRTKMLMFSGRPLFIADRKWQEFWNSEIVPYKHFIPVKEDLSDLIEKLDWAEENPDKVLAIAQNAKSFAVEKLTREAAIDYFANVLIKCSKERK